MTWVRIDDQFADHPKVVAAGPEAAWLDVCAMCYSQRYLTNGFVPEGVVPRPTLGKNEVEEDLQC